MTHSNTHSLRLLTSVKALVAVGLFGLIAACGSLAPGGAAPVEDRGTMQRAAPSAPVASAPTASANGTSTIAKPLPGQENAGKPGYYTIRPGDTLIRIGLDAGQSWRDIARWNGLDNPNIIEVGQVVRIIPPGTAAVVVAAAPPANASANASANAPAAAPSGDGVVTRPVTAPSVVTATTLPAAGTRTAAAATPTPAPAPAPSVTPTPVPAPAANTPLPPASSPSDEDIGWIWPAAGNVIATFDEVKNKGVGISGKLGDPILAAGDGRVVYAGAGLRGYGNLVILKHNNTYLTAYAHNQTLLVKEDQTVRKGQKIAEMGNSDSDRIKLHFEIRRQGKPVDPLRFLPAR